MKIDLHTHILPKTWPDLKERTGYGGWPRIAHDGSGRATILIEDQFFREISESCWNPARRLEECDRHQISLQVLSTVPVMFSYWARPKHALDLCRILNDHVASVVREHPSRFVGLGTLPMQDPDLARAELERCVKDLHLAGVEIGTHVNEWNLDEPTLFPLLKRAEELGASVFVHPWEMMGQERMPRYFLPWLVGMPAETSLAICSLIFGGVLDRLPGLRVCFAHGGGSFPITIGRIEHAFFARPDLCQVNIRNSPRTYVRRLYLDSLVHDPEALRYLIKLFGAERIALGTDYPFALREHVPGRHIEEIPELSTEEKEQLLYKTALEFLALKCRSTP